MQVSLRQLAKEIAGYGLGQGIVRVLGLAVALIYPRLLSQPEYGSVDVVTGFIALLVLILFLGLDAGLSRYYYEDQETHRRRDLVATAFCTVLTVVLPVIGLLLIVSRPLALALYVDPKYVLYLRIALIIIPFNQVHSFQMLLLRLNRRVKAYNVLAFTNQLVAAVVGIGSILIMGLGVTAVLLGLLAGYMVTSTIGTLLNWSQLWHRPHIPGLRKMLGIGLPVMMAALPFWALQFIDRPFLTHMVSQEEIGWYGMANGVVAMLGLAIVAFQNAWQPFSFAIMGRENSEAVYARTLTFVTAIGGGVVVASSLFAREEMAVIGWLTNKQWQGAAPSIGPLVIGALFYTMYLVVQTGVYIKKRTGGILAAMSAAAAVNILLNLILIPEYRILGAAIATAAGYLTSLAVIYRMALRTVRIPYELDKVVPVCAMVVALVGLAPYAGINNGFLGAVLIKLGLCAVYAAGLFVVRVVTLEDLRLIVGALQHKKPTAQDGSEKETQLPRL